MLGPNPPLIVSGSQALQSPYTFPKDWDIDVVRSINSLLYPGGRIDPWLEHPIKHIATVIENPPPELANNLGVQMLPGCAWFQVEFLMPEDPRNSLTYNNPNDPTYAQRWDMPRWTQVDPGATYVFVPDTAANRDAVAGDPNLIRLLTFAKVDPLQPQALTNQIVRMWPYAIRVTVRVFDRQGRLKEPIVRSIVHRFD
jgi:hypothetical protein